jgi:phosphatidylinositol glycan class V
MSTRERRIIVLALLSRLICVSLCLPSTFFGRGAVFHRNRIVLGVENQESVIYRLTNPLIQWDGNHFLNIAISGYDSVLSHAFFPGLPILMRIVSFPFSSVFGYSPVWIAFAGLFIIQCSFIIGSVGLYRLCLHFCATERIAFRSTLFYIFGSSNVFMSALYTESPFSALLFWGLYMLYVRKNLFLATMLLTGAGFFRSNGILSVAFVLHEALLGNQSPLTSLLASSTIYLPYFLYSTWSRNLYCNQGAISAWCESFDSIYGYIQGQFWDVSLLSYWKLRNLGYFLLMTPSLIVSVSCAVLFLKRLLVNTGSKSSFSAALICCIFNREIPFLAQIGILTAFTVFIANCQILTRILSSCPIYFWTIEKLTRDRESVLGRFLLILHLSFFLIGPLVFSNGMNWT